MGGPLLLSIITFMIVYAVHFSNDFKKEDLDKAVPFLVVVFIIILAFNMISLITSS